MKKLLAIGIFLFLAMGYGVVFNCAVRADDKIIEWKFQTEHFESDCAVKLTCRSIVKWLSDATDGKLKVTLYPSGAIVAPTEVVRATMLGVVEMAHGMAASPAMIVPEAHLLSMHGAVKSLGQQYDLIYRKGILELVREGFKKKGLHFLCAGLTGPLVTMSNSKVEKWSDYNGKKGWADPLTGDIIPSLGGGVSISVPGWDMYTAMKLGTIEWFHWTIPELDGTNLKEVVKYCVIDPMIMTPCDAIYVNQKAWDKLGPKMQDKIEKYFADNIMKIGYDYRDVEAISIQKSVDYGVQFIKMEKSEVNRYYEACYRDWDRIAKKSPLCARGVEIVRQHAKRLICY